MPYMFDSLEEFRALVDAMWDQNNEWAIKEGGCRLLCILDIGYRQLTTSAKHPVRKLADAKGHRDPHAAERPHGVHIQGSRP